jgi:hypothetical protein
MTRSVVAALVIGAAVLLGGTTASASPAPPAVWAARLMVNADQDQGLAVFSTASDGRARVAVIVHSVTLPAGVWIVVGRCFKVGEWPSPGFPKTLVRLGTIPATAQAGPSGDVQMRFTLAPKESALVLSTLKGEGIGVVVGSQLRCALLPREPNA